MVHRSDSPAGHDNWEGVAPKKGATFTGMGAADLVHVLLLKRLVAIEVLRHGRRTTTTDETVMERIGIEPMTSWLQTRRSPS